MSKKKIIILCAILLVIASSCLVFFVLTKDNPITTNANEDIENNTMNDTVDNTIANSADQETVLTDEDATTEEVVEPGESEENQTTEPTKNNTNNQNINTSNNNNNNSATNTGKNEAPKEEESIFVKAPTLSVGAGAQGYAELTTALEGAYVTEDSVKQVDGFELYEKNGNQYTKVDSWKITIDVGESKTYVARAYAYNKSNAKVYSAYSNEIKLRNDIATPTLSVGAGAQGYAELTTALEGAYVTEDSLKQVDGFELYEKNGNQYTKVDSWKITIDVGESKTYVARAYAYNKSNVKIYSGYSNELDING